MLNRRNALLESLNQSKLPSEYQEVEYLKSTGTQKINTNYYVTSATRIVCDVKFELLQTNGAYYLGMCHTDNLTSPKRPNIAFGIEKSKSTNSQVFFMLDVSSSHENIWHSISAADENRHVWDIKSGEQKIDYITVSSYSYDDCVVATVPFFLFARKSQWNANGDYFGKMTIFAFKFYENNSVTMDLIPCYRKSDNVAGMYDLVSKTFFTNLGTGEFLVGDDV